MQISIRQGETLELTIVVDDDTAETVQILVSNEADAIILNETANFAIVEGKNTAVITTNDTNIAVGEHKYMLKVVYSDGAIEHLPNTLGCDDCELPVFEVCASISE